MARGTHDLDHLAESIANAMHHAQALTEEQHLVLLDRFFDSHDGPGGQKMYRPKVVQVELPHLGDEEDAVELVNVPLISLIPIGSLLIDELKVVFRANLESVEPHPGVKAQPGGGGEGWFRRWMPGGEGAKLGVAKGAGTEGPGGGDTPLKKAVPNSASEGKRMMVSLGGGGGGMFSKKKPTVGISITFKAGDPPEGLVRMNDRVIKQIP